MTDEKVNDQRPTPGPHARWRISAETLSATRSNPPAVLAEFVGFTAEDPLPPDLREILALIK